MFSFQSDAPWTALGAWAACSLMFCVSVLASIWAAAGERQAIDRRAAERSRELVIATEGAES